MGDPTVQAPPAINPAQVGAESLQTQINLAPSVFQATQQFAPGYANLYNQTQQQLLFGSQYFNAGQALQSSPWAIANRAQIEANAAQQGVSPEEWLTRHVNESAASGDTGMQQMLSQYGGTSNNGAINLYQQAVPQLSQIQAQANTAQRQADIGDVANLGAQATAAYRSANPELAAALNSLTGAVNTSANRAAPQIGSLGAYANALPSAAMADVTNANATTTNANLASGGPLLGLLETDASSQLGKTSAIQTALNQQALGLIGTNGALSQDEINRITQQTRGAASARGIYDANSAIAAEAMNTESARRQRLLENQQIALGVDQAGQNQLNAGRSYATAVQGQGQNLSQYNTGQQNQIGMFNAGAQNTASLANAGAANNASLANAQSQNQFALANQQAQADLSKYNAGLSYQQQLANAGLQLQNQQQGISNLYNLAGLQGNLAQDPFQMVLGRSGALNQAGGVVNQAAGANTGAPVFDPFNSSLLNIYAGNQANQLAANTATANNRSALAGSGIGALGQLGGAAIGAGALALFCWVAREVYGKHNPRWLVFRAWLLNEAPGWLRSLYGRYGERFAAYIHDKPAIKSVIRRLMDIVVTPRMAANIQPV